MHDMPYLDLARRWLLVVLIATGLGGATALFVSGRITPTYETTATLLVNQQAQEGILQRADIETGAMLAAVYTQLIPTQPILDLVAADGSLDLTPGEIGERLEVEQLGQSQLILIRASDSSPERAQQIANTVAAVFISSTDTGLRSASAQVTIAEAASVPGYPVSPRKSLNAAGGAMLAFVACVALIALIEYLDDSVKRSRQVAALGARVLGEVRTRVPKTAAPGYIAADADPATAEAYRYIRTALSTSLGVEEGEGFEHSVVLVTSPTQSAAKSPATGNLAVIFGLAGYRTLLIEANLRSPQLHQTFATSNDVGLTSILTGGLSARDAIRVTSHRGVSLLPAGPLPAHAADLLGSAGMRTLLRECQADYDLVIVDSPAILEVADAAALAAAADVAVIVAQGGRTKAHQLRDAVAKLESTGCMIAGVILDHTRGGTQPTENLRTEEQPLRLVPPGQTQPRNEESPPSGTATLPATRNERPRATRVQP